LPLAGSFARSSYRVRLTLRRLNPREGFAMILPVADQQVALFLDYVTPGTRTTHTMRTTLAMVDGKAASQVPGAVEGQQVQDSEPHDLEITVEAGPKTAKITATLDDRPLYEWTGPASALRLNTAWPAFPPSTLALGAMSADWVVSAVKVKRLEAGK